MMMTAGPLTGWAELRVAGAAATLAFTAGFTNVVGLVADAGGTGPLSHVTGALSHLAALAAVEAEGADAHGGSGPLTSAQAAAEMAGGAAAGLVVAGFATGAVAAGVIVGPSLFWRFRLGARYAAGFALEAALLLATWLLLAHGSIAGRFTAGVAMGVQNGLSTVYSGALLRTTHMTGVLTDIGVVLGQRVHQAVYALVGTPHETLLLRAETWRLRFLVPILVAFALGGIVGLLLFSVGGAHVLAVPMALSALCALVALAYHLRDVVRRRRGKADGVEFVEVPTTSGDIAGADDSTTLSDDSSVPASSKPGHERRARAHRFRALGFRGDWDILPHTIYLRNAVHRLVQLRLHVPAHNLSSIPAVLSRLQLPSTRHLHLGLHRPRPARGAPGFYEHGNQESFQLHTLAGAPHDHHHHHAHHAHPHDPLQHGHAPAEPRLIDLLNAPNAPVSLSVSLLAANEPDTLAVDPEAPA